MDISVNQQHVEVNDSCNLQQLLLTVWHTPAKGIAIAVNQSIVPKSGWESHVLSPGDQITIIKATQGG